MLPGYCIRHGSSLDRSLLVKFMQLTYQEMFPDGDFSHLAQTVEQYFSSQTPLWWVEEHGELGVPTPCRSWGLGAMGRTGDGEKNDGGLGVPTLWGWGAMGRTGDGEKDFIPPPHHPTTPPHHPIACLWIGNAIDQVTGDRHAHIFLLYVVPEHRRRGIATALMRYAEDWAKNRGDQQMGLQVFQSNQAALNLYSHLGYKTQSLWLKKLL
nr:GNAT family N-acetyltransferase [Fischerella sp. FACHB-380]